MLNSTPLQRLIQVASRLDSLDSIEDRDPPDDAQISNILADNKEALESVKNLIGPECERNVHFESCYWDVHREEMDALRRISFYLDFEFKQASASKCFLATIQIADRMLGLANVIRRGGLVVDALVSNAIAARAYENLRKIRTEISPAERRLVLNLIRNNLAEREDFGSIVERDRKWDKIVTHALGSSAAEKELLETDGPDSPAELLHVICNETSRINNLPLDEQEELFWNCDNSGLATGRLLVVDMTLRNLRDAAGIYPATLDPLADELSDELVLDPYTGRIFCYRPMDEGRAFELYSTGPSQRDNGGKFGSWFAVMNQGFDYCLDANDYQTNSEF